MLAAPGLETEATPLTSAEAPADLPPPEPAPTLARVRTRRPPYFQLPRSARRLVIGGAIGVVLGACVGVLIAFTLVRSSPSWWRTILREDPATVELARQVEHDLIHHINEHRPAPGAPGEAWRSEPWTILIDAAGANAWLNVRLPLWLANQQEEFHWPRNMSDLQVDFDDNEITIGARVRSGDRFQVLTASLHPRIERMGRVWVPASWVNLGRLSVPASWVLERARSGTAEYIPPKLRNLEQTQRLFRAFQGLEPITDRSVFSLSGNHVRILDIRARAGELEITCETSRGAERPRAMGGE